MCYIDGNAGGFSSTRLHHYLTTSSGGQSTSTSIMEKLSVFRVFSVFELISLLSSIHHHIANQVSRNCSFPTPPLSVDLQFLWQHTFDCH